MTISLDIPVRLNINNLEILHQVNRQVVRVVHERDHYTCRCCGFRSTKYQQILNLSGTWRDLDTITTACVFCQQCFSLDAITQMRSGVLVTFPDIEQAALHRLAVEIYLARISKVQEAAQQANASLELLMKTREATRMQLGTDNPQKLAEMFRNCSTDADYAVLNKHLDGVRLFPLDRRILREGELEFNQFPQILAFWRSPFGPYPGGGLTSFPRLKGFAETYL